MIQKQRLIQTFLDLVVIDSPSGNEKEVAKEVLERLKKLGAKADFDNYGNVIGKFNGIGEPFMLNAHLDTVEPGRGIKPIVNGEKITSDGKTILGADPKAGVAAILEAIESLNEDGEKYRPIDVVFTLGEETGLYGSINLDYKQLRAKQGITFDGEHKVTNICISSPGYNRVDATVIGRGAHAGAEPEKGISAIAIVSELISRLKLGRIDEETTANIGLITGGSARNAVPEKVTFEGEVRSRNLDKLEKHSSHFQEVFKMMGEKYKEAKVELVMEREFNPYLLDENHGVIKHIVKTMKKMGLKPVLEHSGGGTDVNIFNTHGIQAVVVGVGTYEAHTTREYAIISQIVETAAFCEQIARTS